ncbi:MAG: hypothetical protein AB1782_02645 [Cyanobacteriota bacterium]
MFEDWLLAGFDEGFSSAPLKSGWIPKLSDRFAFFMNVILRELNNREDLVNQSACNKRF